MTPIIIIGSGIAGLACARRLVEVGLRPIIFDKGHNIGGRVATKHAHGLQFDHGAQYVNARGEAFAAVLGGLVNAGFATSWSDKTRRLGIVGTPGMSALAKGLSAGLDIRQGSQVTKITFDNNNWILKINEKDYQTTRLVITIPAPQVPALIGIDHPLVTKIGTVNFAPCLTLMIAVQGKAPFIIYNNPKNSLSSVVQNSSKSGRSSGGLSTWVAHAGVAMSKNHLAKKGSEIVDLMLPLLCAELGISLGQVTQATAHRWLYGCVTTPLGKPFLRNKHSNLYLGGDWCIGSNIEAAWTSGTALANDIIYSNSEDRKGSGST